MLLESGCIVAYIERAVNKYEFLFLHSKVFVKNN